MSKAHFKCGGKAPRAILARLPLAAAISLAVAAPALAQDVAEQPASAATTSATAQKAKTLGTVTVTAQRRTEDLQKVPISINVLAQDQLEALHVQNFKDYVKYLPSVSFQDNGGGNGAQGFAIIYMRGVSSGSGGDGAQVLTLTTWPCGVSQGGAGGFGLARPRAARSVASLCRAKRAEARRPQASSLAGSGPESRSASPSTVVGTCGMFSTMHRRWATEP